MFKKIILDGEITRWSINENGKVRNDERGKFLTGTILHTYRYINFRWNGKQKNKAVHRLVAETFLPNPENLSYVHHIDGNRLNNKLENLQWVTHEENIKLIPNEKLKNNNQFIAKKVIQLDLNNKYLAIFNSAYEAGKKTGCNHRHISEVCQGKRKTTGGFKWKYFESSTTNSSDKCCEMGDFTISE